jgi:single-stranded-DNA-specific exonuclease
MAQIKNLKKAAQRIKKAVKGREKIILFGDADLDGTTSVLILEESIKSLGFSVEKVYFPDRNREGYGLQKSALRRLKKYSPALLVLLDCGITNFEEVKLARELGFEVIIIEHHEILDTLPEAEIIVDPKQKGDSYPFKYLATCGISFKLAEEIFGQGFPSSIRKSFLELAALGTLADKMPQRSDNEEIIAQGISLLPATARPGLRAFLKIFSPAQYTLQEIAQRISSILQITQVKNNLTEGYILLSEPNEQRAEELVSELLEESKKRQLAVKELTESITQKLQRQEEDEVIIFEAGEKIPYLLSGAVAGRLANRFKKPAFICSATGSIVRCSIRSLQGINCVEALRHCSKFLDYYGGHPPAAGFTAKRKNLPALKKCLSEYFEKEINSKKEAL